MTTHHKQSGPLSGVALLAKQLLSQENASGLERTYEKIVDHMCYAAGTTGSQKARSCSSCERSCKIFGARCAEIGGGLLRFDFLLALLCCLRKDDSFFDVSDVSLSNRSC